MRTRMTRKKLTDAARRSLESAGYLVGPSPWSWADLVAVRAGYPGATLIVVTVPVGIPATTRRLRKNRAARTWTAAENTIQIWASDQFMDGWRTVDPAIPVAEREAA